jgi:hypothetical protein
MAELKTQPTNEKVTDFLDKVVDPVKRRDSYKILELLKKVTGEEPVMWGTSIVGFGRYHYQYASGREGDWMLTGFSPRKQALTLYILSGFDEYDDLLGKLGKYKAGVSCLYIKKMEDIDQEVLEELVNQSVDHMKKSNLEE